MFRNDVKEELGAKADALDIDLRIGVSTGEMIVGTVGLVHTAHIHDRDEDGDNNEPDAETC